MPSNYSSLADTLRSLDKEGNKHSMFAFVERDVKPQPSFLSKSPLTALFSLRGRLSSEFPDMNKELLSERTYCEVVSGRFQLVEMHLFVKFNDEHILAQPRSGRGVQVARRHPRGQDAPGALSTSVYGHPPIDYEGLPRDEDL
jgi:hypothetical protein